MASFRYCFNTSTIRGQKLTLEEEIDIAAEAGYQAIEPWIGEIEAHLRNGGTLVDVKAANQRPRVIRRKRDRVCGVGRRR